MHNQPNLVGALSAETILLYAPLLKWYLDHGLKIRAVYRTVDYVPQKAFKRFVEKVTENRRKVEQNTDSLYFALSCDSLKEAVRPELREEFQKWKKRMVCLDQMD